MSTGNDAGTQSQEREFLMERVFDAPRDLVWKAYTYQHGLEDLDGHIWEMFYMDPSAVNQ